MWLYITRSGSSRTEPHKVADNWKTSAVHQRTVSPKVVPTLLRAGTCTRCLGLREAVQRPDNIKQQVSVSSQHVSFTGDGNLAIVEEKPLQNISTREDLWILTT